MALFFSPEDTTSYGQEMVVKELTKAYGYMYKLQELLQQCPSVMARSELVEGHLREVFQSFDVALSVLGSCNACLRSYDLSMEDKVTQSLSSLAPPPPPPPFFLTPTPSSSYETGGGAFGEKQKNGAMAGGSRIRERRRRVCSDSRVKTSYSPYHDGHQWRKYGRKDIKNSIFPRDYYRCTYSDEGCMATKQVQQKNVDNPALYIVTYNHKHTCKSAHSPLPEIVLHDSSPLRFQLHGNAEEDHLLPRPAAPGATQTLNTEEENKLLLPKDEWPQVMNMLDDDDDLFSELTWW